MTLRVIDRSIGKIVMRRFGEISVITSITIIYSRTLITSIVIELLEQLSRIGDILKLIIYCLYDTIYP